MKSLFFSTTLLLSLLFFAAHIEAAIPCNAVITAAAPCLSYTTGKAPKPASTCCPGLQRLVKTIKSVNDKRQVCQCLKDSAKNMGIQDTYLSKLPSMCKIDVGFAVSTSTVKVELHFAVSSEAFPKGCSDRARAIRVDVMKVE